jgi:c-di-GMP-binding flagellar brake protein YcgR
VHRRGAERRRFVRVAEEVVTSVVAIGDGVGRDGRTLNFSAGGVLLLHPTRIEAGTDIRVTLRVPDVDDGLSFDARVVRVRTQHDHAHEIAAEFVGGSLEDQRRLQETIAERLAPPPEPRAPISA